jgi:type I restriction enzyme S subunit
MERNRTTIGEVCEFVGGSQPPKSEFLGTSKEGYVRFIQTRDYKTSEFLTYIPRNRTTKFCSKDDIMIGRYGPPIFQICRGLEGAYNVALMKAKPKPSIRNKYLYYLLKQRAVFEYVDRLSARTGGQTGVDLTSLRNYPVLLPPLDYQRQVENVLGDIDAKIELNNRINEELEGMAKLLYDYWFVQFDFPITAAQAAAMGKPKLEGKPYRASGGKMIFNEALKREIPEGWDVLRVGDVLAKELRTKNILSSEIADRGRIPVVDQGSAYICGFTDDEASIINETPKIVFGDHTRILKFINFPFARGADGTQVLTSREERLPQHLFFYQLVSFDLSSYGYARHFKFLKDQKVVLPDQAVASAFDQIAASLYTKIKNSIFENQELAEFRDWLLPMLINGQVTVG